jgi:phage-related protein
MAQDLPQIANDNLTAPNSNDNPQPGNPSTPAGARSVVANTSISTSNSNLAHVCDITGPLRYSIAWLSLQVKQLVEAIRQTIEGVWSGVSNSPFGDEVRTVIKAIQNKVKQIQSLIAKAKEVQSTIQKFIADAQALIAYIASLPARIVTLLQQCLTSITSSIKDAITNASSIVTDSTNASLTTASTNLNNVSTTSPASSAPAPASKP